MHIARITACLALLVASTARAQMSVDEAQERLRQRQLARDLEKKGEVNPYAYVLEQDRQRERELDRVVVRRNAVRAPTMGRGPGAPSLVPRREYMNPTPNTMKGGSRNFNAPSQQTMDGQEMTMRPWYPNVMSPFPITMRPYNQVMRPYKQHNATYKQSIGAKGR